VISLFRSNVAEDFVTISWYDFFRKDVIGLLVTRFEVFVGIF